MMKRFAKSIGWLLLASSLPLCLAAAPATVPPAAAGRGAATGAGRGANAGAAAQAGAPLNRAFYSSEMELLALQVTLTDAQRAKVQNRIDAMNGEIDTFLQNAPAQIAAARRGARAGRAGAGGGRGAGGGAGRGAGGGAGRGAATTPNAPGAVNPPAVKLQDDLQQLIDQHQILIDLELTAEQRTQWEAYKLQRTLESRLVGLSLTDDQRDKVRTLVDQTAATLAKTADSKEFATTQGQLFRKVVADVLTDAQVSRLMRGVVPVQGQGQGRAGQPASTAPERP